MWVKKPEPGLKPTIPAADSIPILISIQKVGGQGSSFIMESRTSSMEGVPSTDMTLGPSVFLK